MSWNDDEFEHEGVDDGPGEADADLMGDDGNTFDCPECGRSVWGDAEVCPGCGRFFMAGDRTGGGAFARPAGGFGRYGGSGGSGGVWAWVRWIAILAIVAWLVFVLAMA